jgi:Arc/MetJ-type ribon-helix-helix transcriptional regulator
VVLHLSTETQRLIEERMALGGYDSPEDVIRAALASLEEAEMFADYAPGELEALVEEAEESYRNEGGLSREQVIEPILARLDRRQRRE